MPRPASAASESPTGFQIGARRDDPHRRDHAYVTLLTASGLSLATLIAVATVSIDVVTASVLR